MFPFSHDDVQPIEVGMSHQKPREELENPTVNVVTSSLLDSVEHNHGNPRELEESPKGPNEHVTHSSLLGREDVRPDGAVPIIQTSREELENPTVDDVSVPFQDGVEQDHVSPRELVASLKSAREIVPRPSLVKQVVMHEVSAES